ncbi:P-loop containing nucleoside triphosphate hydrolase protein [Dissophora ornata]|nr:hypothetical protein BGZ58_000361 [Dissophora ornata]KAI8600936.1 P-loop containing nucleoside triphosphate hydrolase protein [Dissophora ornata]
MFENPEYQGIIDKINKIRGYGLNKMITIPQIAILGDQSSGKSSVLEAITKLSFPRNIDTCTRFATQVNLRRSEREEMTAHIDDEPQFNERYVAQDKAWDLKEIVSDANRILCSNVEISEKVLEITISGPTLSPLTIIDLPGYINTTVDGQDKSIVQTIREIGTRYIKDSRTIILAVVPANVDLNNIFVLGEAERYDKGNERTIPIVTKPDTIEEDLLPSLVNTLLNRRKHMKLGYLVMKNSGFKDIEMSWDDARQREDDFFKSSTLWKSVPDARKGRVQVKKFLGELLYTHIKKELPFLKKDILELINECDKEIYEMGPSVSSVVIAKAKYFECILKLKSSLTAVLDGNYSFEYIRGHKSDITEQDLVVASSENGDGDGDKNDGSDGDKGDDLETFSIERDHRFIRSSLYKLYQDYNRVMNKDKYLLSTDKISELVLRYKGNELPGFVSFTTFIQIFMETLVRWRDVTKAHVANMHIYLYRAITKFVEFTVDPLLKDTLLLEFDKFYCSQTAKIDETIENIFTDESSPFTMNKYYYDNIVNTRKENVENYIQGLVSKYQTAPTDKPIKIDESDINYNEKLAVEDLQEQLQSYCKVARKRIVDVVLLQTVERHMIKQINLYFDMLIAVNDNDISSRLMDSPTTISRREELQEKQAVLRKSLREL